MRSQDEVAAMQCPVCRVPLAMSDRQGIEIDYCPQCRGVWLDRGELDKIIERGAAAAPAPQPTPQAPPPPQSGAWSQPQPGAWPQQQPGYGHGHGKPYNKKKKHWLSDLFDD